MTFRTSCRAIGTPLALLAGLIVVGPAGSARAQTKPAEAPAKSSGAEQIRKAIEAVNQDDYVAGVAALDEAVKLDPKNRKALYLLSLFGTMGADKAKADTERLALLRKSAAAYARIGKLGGDLTPEEAEFAPQAQLNDARILALEGKPRPALDAIVAMISGGYDDLDSIEEQADFKSVVALPDFKSRTEQALLPGVKAAIAATKAFPFDFNLKDVDGKAVKLGDFRGNVTIVDIWGTWCPPCRKEIPHFVELNTRYGSKGLKIVGINCNEEGTDAEIKKSINDFKVENKISYPCVLNDGKIEEQVAGFQGYPTTLFLDRAGKVRLVLVGYTRMARLEAIVSTLLAEPKS